MWSIDTAKRTTLGYGPDFINFSASAARAHGRQRDLVSAPKQGEYDDGRGPQNGQIRTLLALRGPLRSQADPGAGILRRAEHAGRKGAQAFGRVGHSRHGEGGGAEAEGPHGPQPRNGRTDQDRREDRGESPDCEAAERRRSSQ